jgi:hypothetical protein
VREPLLGPRGLAWLQRERRVPFDGESLHTMLELEKLNLG